MTPDSLTVVIEEMARNVETIRVCAIITCALLGSVATATCLRFWKD